MMGKNITLYLSPLDSGESLTDTAKPTYMQRNKSKRKLLFQKRLEVI